MSQDQQVVDEAIAELLSNAPPDSTDQATFNEARFDAGLAWVWNPSGRGGLSVDRSLQPYVERRLHEVGAPPPLPNGLGMGMAGPTIASHGSPAQQDLWLRRVFCSGEFWCQLFSEPGAGSDLAGLSTRAIRDGDEWVVNGQKVWNSGASVADWGLLPARSDPNVPKHKGLTFFVVDMSAPGVDARPLRSMPGVVHFNEVFLEDVRVPDDHRIGEVGQGWSVLLTTLMNERLVFTGASGPVGAPSLMEDAEAAYRATPRPALRDQLLRLWIETKVVGWLARRASEALRKQAPGHEGSLGKVAMTELNQRVSDLTTNLMGPQGMLLPHDYPQDGVGDDDFLNDPRVRFIRARANTIEGGTSEIHRNNIAERVLGLPREDRPDNVLPWSEVPR